MTDHDIQALVRHHMQELTEFAESEPSVTPYWSRLQTRLIVTNTLDAHLKPEAPKDVAVYYLVPGAKDEHLSFWKLAVMGLWVTNIEQRFERVGPNGMRRGILQLLPLDQVRLDSPTQAQRDEIHTKGYNLVRCMPGIGYALWDNVIWRNGAPVRQSVTFGDPNFYKNIATPLALVE
jgi:hypothetical protein